MNRFLFIILVLLLLTGISSKIQAQATTGKYVKFSYDAAGNRIQRKILIGTPPDGGRRGTFTQEHPAQDSIGITAVSIYPNPTASLLNITFSNAGDAKPATIILYDNVGKAVIRKEGVTGNIALDLSAVAVGNYELLLSSGDKNTIWKIVKE